MSSHAWNPAPRGMEEGRVHALLHGTIRPSHRRDQTIRSTMGQNHEDTERDTGRWDCRWCKARESPPTRSARAHEAEYEVSLHKMPRGRDRLPQERRKSKHGTSPAQESRLPWVRGD